MGIDNIPNVKVAGNVLRPKTTLKLSVRAPPTLDVFSAREDLKKLLEENPPYNAHVKCTINQTGPGWNAPSTKPYLEKILTESSYNFYGK